MRGRVCVHWHVLLSVFASSCFSPLPPTTFPFQGTPHTDAHTKRRQTKRRERAGTGQLERQKNKILYCVGGVPLLLYSRRGAYLRVRAKRITVAQRSLPPPSSPPLLPPRNTTTRGDDTGWGGARFRTETVVFLPFTCALACATTLPTHHHFEHDTAATTAAPQHRR